MGLLSPSTKYFLTHWETLAVAFDCNHRTERKSSSTQWTFIESIFTAPLTHIKVPVPHAPINYLPELEVLLTHVTWLTDKSVFRTSYSGNLMEWSINTCILFSHLSKRWKVVKIIIWPSWLPYYSLWQLKDS